MKISVIVPVYNSGSYLWPCIESICRQTYGNVEIICVNDGSDDNSGEILDELSKQDPRIQVITQENRGVSVARNAGLEAATGDLLSFIDSDDTLSPDMYEVLVGLMEEHNADVAHCGYRRMRADGSFVDVSGTGKLYIQNAVQACECLIAGKLFVGGLWNKLYRRHLFTGIQFDPELKFNEDVLLNVQVFRKTETSVFLDEPKYYYYERETSSCSTTGAIKKGTDCALAAEKMLTICNGTPLERACAERIRRVLQGLYRAYLMEDVEASKAERERIHARLCEIEPMCNVQSAREVWNYRFMRYLPGPYRTVYRSYDRIRKPNWDL